MRYIFSLLSIAILFVGCGTKKEYFEPKNVTNEAHYTDSLPDDIKSISRYGATLENQQIITQDGLQDVKLKDGFSFIGEFDERIISVNAKGDLHILSQSGEEVYKHTFPQAVATASIKGNILAVVDSNNGVYLVDIQKDKIYFTNNQDKIYAVDARMAAPYFLSSLVVFPTLDGKLLIVDKNQGRLIKSVVISSERFFNNVIYLNVKNNRLIAATATRVLCIDASNTSYFDADIKDIIATDDRVIVLTVDGFAKVLDMNLKLLKEHKFLFAVFVALMHDDELYIVERNGYLIKSDMDFNHIKIYELPSDIDEPLFMGNDTIFYEDEMIQLDEKYQD